MKNPIWKALLQYWLPLAFVITALSTLVYVAVQQDMRQNANDPQIQMAEDAATALGAGASLQSVITTGTTVDIANSLAPYMIVFDTNGKVIASDAVLNGAVPLPPPGILSYTQQSGEDRVTWEPQPGVRSAIVVKSYHGAQSGFVLAGRSIREVEKRENSLNLEVTLFWIAGVVGTFILTAGIALLISR